MVDIGIAEITTQIAWHILQCSFEKGLEENSGKPVGSHMVEFSIWKIHSLSNVDLSYLLPAV